MTPKEEQEHDAFYLKLNHYKYLITNVKNEKSICENGKCSVCGNSSTDIEVREYKSEIETFNLCSMCYFVM
jgi:hypothetical protein